MQILEPNLVFIEQKKIIKKFTSLLLIFFILISSICAKVSAEELTKITVATFDNPEDITSISIGSSVTSISSNAFVCMVNLRSIEVSENNSNYASYSGCLYDKDLTTLLCVPSALKSTYIPESVVSIGPYALKGVSTNMKKTIKSIVEAQADSTSSNENVKGATRLLGDGETVESLVKSPHFEHTQDGIKWENSDGELVTADNALMKSLAIVLDENTDSSMLVSDELEAMYDALVENYELLDSSTSKNGDFAYASALSLLSRKMGDSYDFASAFAYMGACLGYKSKVVTGFIEDDDGIVKNHAYAEIYISDTAYIFDPAYEIESGENCYKLSSDGNRSRTATYTIILE